MTKVVVLEKFKKNWDIGSVVTVKDGYARNYLIPNGKAKFAIKKYSKGSFKFMRFESSSDFTKKLDGFLKFNSDCLRFLITKSNNTLEESTPQVNKDS